MVVPEWDIFNRIDGLEKLKPTVDDATNIAVIALLLSFAHLSLGDSSHARAGKDSIVGHLRDK